jgi:hypothetical protein
MAPTLDGNGRADDEAAEALGVGGDEGGTARAAGAAPAHGREQAVGAIDPVVGETALRLVRHAVAGIGKGQAARVGAGELGQVARGHGRGPDTRAGSGDRREQAGHAAVGECAPSAVDGGEAGQLAACISICHRGQAVCADPVGLLAGGAEVDLAAVGGGVGKTTSPIDDERPVVRGRAGEGAGNRKELRPLFRSLNHRATPLLYPSQSLFQIVSLAFSPMYTLPIADDEIL